MHVNLRTKILLLACVALLLHYYTYSILKMYDVNWCVKRWKLFNDSANENFISNLSMLPSSKACMIHLHYTRASFLLCMLLHFAFASHFAFREENWLKLFNSTSTTTGKIVRVSICPRRVVVSTCCPCHVSTMQKKKSRCALNCFVFVFFFASCNTCAFENENNALWFTRNSCAKLHRLLHHK